MKYIFLSVGIIILLGLFVFLPDKKAKTNNVDQDDQLGKKIVHDGYLSYNKKQDFAGIEGDIVLFFHADWCSSCNQVEKNILKKGVPEGLTIYKVNFDENDDLLRKYNILTQSSFAQIDNEGELIKRRVGGYGIDDIVEKLADNEEKPWEKAKKERDSQIMVDTSKSIQPKPATAYFAGGCFWCLEGPFEALDGVDDVISGYAGGVKENATYEKIGTGKTKHREAVKVTYDASRISFDELVRNYWYQIDPTDSGGQFADRGYQYTTALYYQNQEEKEILLQAKKALNDAGKFDDPIVVKIEPFTTFFPAEEAHQGYYLKQSDRYDRYKKGSGRAGFIDETRKEELEKNALTFSTIQDKAGEKTLTKMQRDVIFNEGTEPPFNNKYWDHKEDGIYVDLLDGTPLFSSTDKFDSGTGWPSFTTPIDELLVELKADTSYGMKRVEVETKNNTHLGHVFDDGPGGKKRYCINSAALDFVPLNEMKEKGYADYLVLFQ